MELEQFFPSSLMVGVMFVAPLMLYNFGYMLSQFRALAQFLHILAQDLVHPRYVRYGANRTTAAA